MSAGVRPIPIRTGPATPSMHTKLGSAKNGSGTIGCPKMLPNWLSAGLANPPAIAAVPPNPQRSTDGYIHHCGVDVLRTPVRGAEIRHVLLLELPGQDTKVTVPLYRNSKMGTMTLRTEAEIAALKAQASK